MKKILFAAVLAVLFLPATMAETVITEDTYDVYPDSTARVLNLIGDAYVTNGFNTKKAYLEMPLYPGEVIKPNVDEQAEIELRENGARIKVVGPNKFEIPPRAPSTTGTPLLEQITSSVEKFFGNIWLSIRGLLEGPKESGKPAFASGVRG